MCGATKKGCTCWRSLSVWRSHRKPLLRAIEALKQPTFSWASDTEFLTRRDTTSRAMHLKFRVAKLVKSFGPLGKSAESLDDSRYTLSEI